MAETKGFSTEIAEYLARHLGYSSLMALPKERRVRFYDEAEEILAKPIEVVEGAGLKEEQLNEALRRPELLNHNPYSDLPEHLRLHIQNAVKAQLQAIKKAIEEGE